MTTRVSCLAIWAALAGSAPGPHLEEVAKGVWAAGFSARFDSANCGWAVVGNETILIDLPRGIALDDFLPLVEKRAGRPARALALTRLEPGDAATIEDLVRRGIRTVWTSEPLRRELVAAAPGLAARVAAEPGGGGQGRPAGGRRGGGGLSSGAGVLFAGPAVVNGPRSQLAGSDSALWISSLRALTRLQARHVVPGFGSWGGAALVDRELRFLTELRRQVAYAIAQGRPRALVVGDIQIGADYQVWMPYDNPAQEDIDWVYRELTVPSAPFGGRPPEPADARPHALVLVGDAPHEPGHIEEGLRPVVEATGVVPHFTVDVRALAAENLARVRLLVILRDGWMRPRTGEKSEYVWMTPGQERAVVEFVERGGGFLNLHNAMGLYPADGPYLHLVGGRYIGHGPLERFRVEVVDPAHPITRGVTDFFSADEQHTPPYDATRVHLLLRNRSDDGQSAAAGWAYEPGRGRLCHLANGHTRESLLHPMYQRLMRNAVRWCLRLPEVE